MVQMSHRRKVDLKNEKDGIRKQIHKPNQASVELTNEADNHYLEAGRETLTNTYASAMC